MRGRQEMKTKNEDLLNRADVPTERATYSGAGEMEFFLRRVRGLPAAASASLASRSIAGRTGHLLRNSSLFSFLLLLISFSFLLLSTPADAKKLKVATTLSDFASLAQTIGGDR